MAEQKEQSYIARFLEEGIEAQRKKDYRRAEDIFNRVLNRVPHNLRVLHRLAFLYSEMEYNGIAITIMERVLHECPDDKNILNDLGVLWRKENFFDVAEGYYRKSIEIGGEDALNCGNLAGIYADSCRPEEALFWCNKALSYDPDNISAHWQRSLANLTLRNWQDGWGEYHYREQLDGWHSRTNIDVPRWNFKETGHLYIHGEQGIGDEIMFLSCLDDVLPLCKRVTIEVHPAVAPIVRKTWPQVRVVTGEAPGRYDAKIPIGSLAAQLRRSTDAFPGTPYLKPAPARVQWYRNELARLGKPPYIALTWMGGMKATRVENRSFDPALYKPLMDKYTCVSAQYFHTNAEVEAQRHAVRLSRFGEDSCGKDLAEQAALFEAVDAVVTAQQTAVHVAGAVGTKTFVLLPPNPQWRYGLESTMPWYDSVTLYRHSGEWKDLIPVIVGEVDAHFGAVQRTEQAVA